MSAMSDYLEQKVLESLLEQASFPSLSALYLGLCTTLFVDSDVSPFTKEVSGGSYARVNVTAAFDVADAGSGQWQGKNDVAITFPQATAYWGTVVGFGLFDASSGGNLLVHGALAASQDIAIGNRVQFNADAIIIEAQ